MRGGGTSAFAFRYEKKEMIPMSTPEELKTIREKYSKYNGCISAGFNRTMGLKTDGSVITTNGYANSKMSVWRNITAVSVGGECMVGLRADGTTIVFAHTFYVQDINDWRDIVSVSVGKHHIIGLRTDGSVISWGNNMAGQCNTSEWHDIIEVSAKINHTVALKSDGTVYDSFTFAEDWRDIAAVSAGGLHTVGLKTDGTVVSAGMDDALKIGQCKTGDWRDIIAVSAGEEHTVGLKADGTVIAIGDNTVNQCDTNDWRDIVAVSAGDYHTVGLKSDGVIRAVGGNHTVDGNNKTYEDGRCKTGDWRDIGRVDKIKLLNQLKADQDAWERQGLCIRCGGRIGGLFIKKCNICKKSG